jgi:putative SOS response-associated peptidase YedK
MCGRYAFVTRPLGRWRYVFKTWIDGENNRYNIAPSAIVPVFTSTGWQLMRWGLVPSWSKEPSHKYSTFNARAESLLSKPAYRSAWKHGQRCLVPSIGYFEWKKTQTSKQPYFIRSEYNELLVYAGLWDRWENDNNELLSCSIVTTEAQSDLKELHNRMPLMLDPETATTWLHGKADECIKILNTPPAVKVVYYEVDASVGNTKNQGEKLIEPREDFSSR